MDVDDTKVDLKGQVQGHEVEKCYFRSHSTTLKVIFEVKGHMGQCQRSHGSMPKVDLEDQGQRSRELCQNVISGLI